MKLPSKLKLTLLSVGLLVAAWIGWRAYGVFAMPDVHPHVGDGNFEPHSWRFPWGSVGLPVPGYRIKFGEFDLGSPFDAIYDVEDLAIIGREVGVYLCVDDPDHRWQSHSSRKGLSATVELEVLDAADRTVCHVSAPLAKMFWSGSEGGPNTYGLYLLDDSFFLPRQNEHYQIRIRYFPNGDLSGFKGFVYLRCGGSI